MNRSHSIFSLILPIVLFFIGGSISCCFGVIAYAVNFPANNFDQIDLVGTNLDVEIKGISKESALISVELTDGAKSSTTISFEQKGRVLMLKQKAMTEPHPYPPSGANRHLASLSRPRLKILSPPRSLGINILTGDVLLNDWSGSTQSNLIEGKMVIHKGSGHLTGSIGSGEASFKNFQGNLELDLNQGDVHLTEFEGNAQVGLMKGQIVVHKLLGNLNLINYSSSAKIYKVSGDVQFENYRGDLKFFELKGAVQGKSQEGNVWLDLHNDSNVSIEAGTGRTTVKTKGSAKLNLQTEGAEIYVPEGIDVGRIGHQKFVRSTMGHSEDESSINIRSTGGMIILK